MAPPSPSPIRDLNRAVAAKTLSPAYFLYGEERFVRDAKLEGIIEAALDASERDFNLNVRDALELSAEDMDALLNTPPLLAARRVVVIQNISSLKKAPRQILEKYLDAPAPDAVLVLLEDGAPGKSGESLLRKCAAFEFRKLSRDDLEKWAPHHAASLGASISPAAVALLVNAVGDDLSTLAAELDKLASYSSGQQIDVDAVEDLVGVRRGETLADLLDAIAVRDATRALNLLGHVLEQPRVNGVSIVLSLTTQTYAMAYARALLDEGEPQHRVERSLFTFLASGKGVMTARPWGEAVKGWMRSVNAWKLAELQAACDALLRADMALKETRSSSDEQLVASLVLQLCAGKAASPGPGKR
jgi:DNA polymerase-3 subunit delta